MSKLSIGNLGTASIILLIEIPLEDDQNCKTRLLIQSWDRHNSGYSVIKFAALSHDSATSRFSILHCIVGNLGHLGDDR